MERENLSTYSTSFLLSAIAMGIELHTYVRASTTFVLSWEKSKYAACV